MRVLSQRRLAPRRRIGLCGVTVAAAPSKRSDTDKRRQRGETKRAVCEMAAFDALPPEVQQFVREANGGWECVKLRKRIAKAMSAKGMWWGMERLLSAYRTEDATA